VNEYTITISGVPMTVQLDDRHAAAMGLLKAPANKQAPAAANKAAAPRNKRGSTVGKPSAARVK
jgi:hypothetical protein